MDHLYIYTEFIKNWSISLKIENPFWGVGETGGEFEFLKIAINFPIISIFDVKNHSMKFRPNPKT